MASHTFTAAGPVAPHWPSVLQTLRGQDATVGLLPDGLSAQIDKSTDWTTAQIAQTQTVIDNAPRDTDQLRAQFEVDGMPLATKALLLTLLDQLNVLRTKVGLATVTPAQAIAAVRDKAGTL